MGWNIYGSFLEDVRLASKYLNFGGFLNMHMSSVFQDVAKCSRWGKCFHLVVVATSNIYLGATAACEIVMKLNVPFYTKQGLL